MSQQFFNRVGHIASPLSVHPSRPVHTKNGFWVVFLRYFGVLDSYFINRYIIIKYRLGAQWLSGRVLDSRPRGCGSEPYLRHCVVSLSKNIDPSLVLVQPRKTRPFITERLLIGRKESNQKNKNKQNKIQVKFLLKPVFSNFVYTFRKAKCTV